MNMKEKHVNALDDLACRLMQGQILFDVSERDRNVIGGFIHLWIGCRQAGDEQADALVDLLLSFIASEAEHVKL